MHDFLIKLGIKEINYGATTGSSKGWIKTTGKDLVSFSPIDGKPIATRQAGDARRIRPDRREGR